jgi:hypothetical protein
MGFMFYETGGVEAGIDGFIELRDQNTGEVSNQILQIQSKATEKQLPAETDKSIEFPVRDKDVVYWRNGTAPVILFIVSLKNNRVYFKSIRDYFADTGNTATRKIVFDKSADLFTKTSGPALIAIAQRIRPGTPTSPVRIDEELTLNLLPIDRLPTTIYWAPTEHTNNKTFGAALREVDPNAPSEWLIKSKAILCLHALDEEPWKQFCDYGAMEEFDADEWAFSDDEERHRDFVQLLNRCLSQKLRVDLRFDRDSGAYFFRPNKGRPTLSYSYESSKRTTARNVVKRYPKKASPTDTAYYRHSAMRGRFHRFGDDWYLEVTPTYKFTRDGYKDTRYEGEYLKKIKELENNAAVQGQFVMWRHYLCDRKTGDLLEEPYPFLGFRSLDPFQLKRGVPDDLWRAQEANPKSTFFSLEEVET